jgi:hypothetical protein
MRYFEFQDGTPFIGVGYNAATVLPADAETIMQRYERYRLNFLRVWLSASAINGTQSCASTITHPTLSLIRRRG